MYNNKLKVCSGPETTGWISEQLMTGKIPVTDIFIDIDNKPDQMEVRLKPSSRSSTRTCTSSSQTEVNYVPLLKKVEDTLTMLVNATSRQNAAIEALENRLSTLESSLKPIQDMGKVISSLNRSCAEMVAKYDLLVMTTGRATSTAAAVDAYWKEHKQPPPGPALYEENALKGKIDDPNSYVPDAVQEAYKNLDSTSTLTEENFGKPYISAKDLKEIMYDHLPGFGTAFHQLVQVICKIGKDNNLLDTIHAEFQASLADGDSPQCALIQITKRVPIFQDVPPPIIHIRSRGDIPRACQKSLRPAPPSPKIDRGWVCLFKMQDGKTLGLKI
ncbi:polymerase complex protein VP35 [Reston ebolavirus]|uniref:Polymerase cofactor VP35 n=2 Tax=Reston ebolavirus TaxID=186539 RepID=VP35_EBORR|nr:polymerase complex protein [Reston ebolavirus]Q8JPY0.1 RecName: Full=Polymerase cofactor VP35 [Reston ebolavirus - Reston (1989)]UJP71100.1 viral protein 35 [synthetic construct]AAN04449.1 polymerase complex protein VP35 [Reston ebolavirus]AAV48575.1 polymerase cofactor VP35 [Reston ebolavirus]APA16569.1 VP35 [Reston ebolavirus]ARU80297.1 VP35 [Reston ebolavirus]